MMLFTSMFFPKRLFLNRSRYILSSSRKLCESKDPNLYSFQNRPNIFGLLVIPSQQLSTNVIRQVFYPKISIGTEGSNIDLVERDINDRSMPHQHLRTNVRSSKQEKFLINRLREAANGFSQLTDKDWEDIKQSVLGIWGPINENNFDAVIISKCSEINSLSLGKSYFAFLKSLRKQINRATYGNYLKLFYDCSHDCSEVDLLEILHIYKELLEVYPVLDTHTAEKAILALSLTKHWKEYKNLFNSIKLFYSPSPYIHAIVIKTAFNNQEYELGWRLMEEMAFQGITIHDEVFTFWLKTVKNNKRDEDLDIVLNFLNKFNIKPSLEVSEAIKHFFEYAESERRGTFTNISDRGECRCCCATLETSQVSQHEYDVLKTAFLDPVLIGKDIFQKTRPEEFNAFIEMLQKTAPYNIVLDGLNIALKVHKSKRSPKMFSFQLKSVVRHFAVQKKKVLVIGRKHMLKWPKEDLNRIRQYAEVFFAEDISQDDPFMLYATLYSGLGTYFVSQDLMRSHMFLLADVKLRAIFLKWQASHQCFFKYVEDNGVVHLKDPVPFLQNIQQNSQGDWHIPYDLRENLTNNDVVDNYHKYWLCLSNKPQRQSYRYEQQRYKQRSSPQNKKVWSDKPPSRQKSKSALPEGLFVND